MCTPALNPTPFSHGNTATAGDPLNVRKTKWGDPLGFYKATETKKSNHVVNNGDLQYTRNGVTTSMNTGLQIK